MFFILNYIPTAVVWKRKLERPTWMHTDRYSALDTQPFSLFVFWATFGTPAASPTEWRDAEAVREYCARCRRLLQRLLLLRCVSFNYILPIAIPVVCLCSWLLGTMRPVRAVSLCTMCREWSHRTQKYSPSISLDDETQTLWSHLITLCCSCVHSHGQRGKWLPSSTVDKHNIAIKPFCRHRHAERMELSAEIQPK